MEIMNTIMNDTGILRLMQVLDSLFPIGAFTMSNGLETYTQKEIIHSCETLDEYLSSYIHALPSNDLGYAAKAASGKDIIRLDEICSAAKSPYELRKGSEKLCSRFIKTVRETGSFPLTENYSSLISQGICAGHHCIAVGLFIADNTDNILTGLQMYCFSLLSAAVNHAVKLVPLRQLEGQRLLSKITPEIPKAVIKASELSEDELGTNGPGFDISSAEHEKLYTRIYIS